MTPEQETKIAIARRFAVYAETYAAARSKYDRNLLTARETITEEARANVSSSGSYAATAAEGVQRQMLAMRKEFRLSLADAARTMQKVCDWLAAHYITDAEGNNLLDLEGRPITYIEWSPNVEAVVNASYDFWRNWRGKLESSRIARGNEPVAA